jgi:uncharacterized protein (TIGR02271 family)
MHGTGKSGHSGTGMTEAYGWEGREIIDRDGERVGAIRALYAEAEGEAPTWAAVTTGLFGTKESFVPLTGAQPRGEQVHVNVSKDEIRGAPRVDGDGDLTLEQERELYRHYGVRDPDDPTETAGDPVATGTHTGAQDSDNAMTRSEEEVDVHTTRRERGRARLRKYVVTEEVRRTVPVQREEARIEREPITEENRDAATAGPEISTAEHEVELYEDVPVVDKRTVPRERVRLEKDTRTDEEQIVEHARREQIEAEGDVDR